MWKKEKNFYGDVEMVGSASNSEASSVEDFDDELDEQGYDMGRSRGFGFSRGIGRRNKWKCWLALLLVTVVVLVLTIVYYSPGFGLVAKGVSTIDNEGEDDIVDTPPDFVGTVSNDSIINNNAYEIMLKIPVKTVQGDLVLYQHKKTRTPVVTILPYDTEQDSVFAISYRTKPSNSHGAPHVLEHSVLTGSKKYPIKDPFTQGMQCVEMIAGHHKFALLI
jgi:hypothetical protein